MDCDEDEDEDECMLRNKDIVEDEKHTTQRDVQ